MAKFREHGVMIFLSRDLYVAFIKLQAEKELGRSFAALLPFTEGLYKLGYISEEVYEAHKKRYSEPLTRETEDEKVRRIRREHGSKKNIERLNKQFGMVVDQWEDHTSKEWRNAWIKKAKQHQGVPNAKRILELVQSKETTLEPSIVLTRISEKKGEGHG